MALDTKGWSGTILAASRYLISSQVGSGGMALVYLAEDRRDGRQVVIKVPRQAMLDDPEFAGRFLREIKSLVRLPHPHIAKILDVGEHEGKPFLVLEYLSGGSLRDRMQGGPQAVHELATWLPGIAAALDFCHQNGCVHRDVKPDNILFDAQGKAYLSDFGIAKVMSKAPKTKMTVLTGAGMVLGTAQYMAPELAMGKLYDGKADQYGLAVTVYEMLGGRTPFTGSTPMAIFVEQSRSEAPPLTSLTPSVPKPVAEVVHRALAKDPTDRFASCTALAQALHKAGSANAIQADPPMHSTVTCPGCQKRIKVPASAAGKQLRCPACKTAFTLPGKPFATSTGKGAVAAETARQNEGQVDTMDFAVSIPQDSRQADQKNWKLIGGAIAVGAVVAGLIAVAGITVGLLAMLRTSHQENGKPVALGQKPVQAVISVNPAETDAQKKKLAPEQNLPKEISSENPKLQPIVPSLKVFPTPAVEIEAGKSQDVFVKVERKGWVGAIDIKLIDLPPSLMAAPAVLATDKSEIKIQLVAMSEAEASLVDVKVVAFLGSLVAEKTIRVKLRTQALAKSNEYKLLNGWSHAFDLACRKLNEANITKDTKRWGVEVFKDNYTGLGLYISQTGCIVAAPNFSGDAPIKANKGSAWLTGLDLPARKAGKSDWKDATTHCVEVFRDVNTDNWLLVTSIGNIAACNGKHFPGSAGKSPKWVHSVDLVVRKSGEKEWKDAKKFGIEVYQDGNTGNTIYITEHGFIAMLPETKEIAGEGKAPQWLHGLDLSCRRTDEKIFTKDTRKFGVEVYDDITTGNLIFITETGSIAVAATPKGTKAPRTNVKEPMWTHGLNIRCRETGEKEFSDKTKAIGAEVFTDPNVGVTVYINDQGIIAVAAAK